MIDLNKLKEAEAIFGDLIQGIDPETKQPLPRDSVIHQPAVIRAMVASREGLAVLKLRSQRRSQIPQNCGLAWSEQEDDMLRAAFREGVGIKDIAKNHRRTAVAIESRLEKLGLITADERQTNNRFVAIRQKTES